MTKMIPWKVSGVGEDARHAARVAADQHGTSVGDWLDRLIAERAGGVDREEPGLDGQDTIDRGRRGPGRVEPRWPDDLARRAAELDAGDEGERLIPRFIRPANEDDASRDRPRRGREPDAHDDAILLLAEAAGEMERRAARGPRSPVKHHPNLRQHPQFKRASGPDEDRLGRLEARLTEMAGHMERVLVEMQAQRGAASRAADHDELTRLQRKLRRAEEAVEEARYASRTGVAAPEDPSQGPAAAAQSGPAPGEDRTGAALKTIYDVLEIIAGELIESQGKSARAGRR